MNIKTLNDKINAYMEQGYTRDQAIELIVDNHDLSESFSFNLLLEDIKRSD